MKFLFPPVFTELPYLWFSAWRAYFIYSPPKFLCRDEITNHIKIRDAKTHGQNKCQSISSNKFIKIPFPNSLKNNHFLMHYSLNSIWVIKPCITKKTHDIINITMKQITVFITSALKGFWLLCQNSLSYYGTYITYQHSDYILVERNKKQVHSTHAIQLRSELAKERECAETN